MVGYARGSSCADQRSCRKHSKKISLHWQRALVSQTFWWYVYFHHHCLFVWKQNCHPPSVCPRTPGSPRRSQLGRRRPTELSRPPWETLFSDCVLTLYIMSNCPYHINIITCVTLYKNPHPLRAPLQQCLQPSSYPCLPLFDRKHFSQYRWPHCLLWRCLAGR